MQSSPAISSPQHIIPTLQPFGTAMLHENAQYAHTRCPRCGGMPVRAVPTCPPTKQAAAPPSLHHAVPRQLPQLQPVQCNKRFWVYVTLTVKDWRVYVTVTVKDWRVSPCYSSQCSAVQQAPHIGRYGRACRLPSTATSSPSIAYRASLCSRECGTPWAWRSATAPPRRVASDMTATSSTCSTGSTGSRVQAAHVGAVPLTAAGGMGWQGSAACTMHVH